MVEQLWKAAFSTGSHRCVVELVGLEPTTKVLWNMVGVRPTHLVGHPSRLPGDQPPECYGTWFESDHLPWTDTLEPTTKVLWNMGVSDQPTSSDTRARAQKVLFDQLVGVAKSAAARNS